MRTMCAAKEYGAHAMRTISFLFLLAQARSAFGVLAVQTVSDCRSSLQATEKPKIQAVEKGRDARQPEEARADSTFEGYGKRAPAGLTTQIGLYRRPTTSAVFFCILLPFPVNTTMGVGQTRKKFPIWTIFFVHPLDFCRYILYHK